MGESYGQQVTLAHGPGDGIDLPVPMWVATLASLFAIIATFTLFATFRNRPRQTGEGKPLPAALSSPALRLGLQAIGLTGFSVVLTTAWFGPAATNQNPAPTWFYVWFWIGTATASLVLGDVYKHLNPLRTLATLLHLIAGRDRELPARPGYIVAFGGIWIFLWLELVAPAGHAPRVVAAFITAYALVHIACGVWFGPQWFDRCDSFGIYFALIARIAPFGRREDGTLLLRNPIDGLLKATPNPPLIAPIILAVLGSTVFDGITHLEFWRQLSISANYSGRPYDAMILGTAGLVGSIVIATTFYVVTMAATKRFIRPNLSSDAREIFAPCLIPIMTGYAVSYSFPVAVFDGQVGYLLPLEGTSSIDYTVVSTALVAWVQLLAIAIAHVIAIIAIRDRSGAALRPGLETVGQLPLTGLVLASAMAGIALI